MDSKSLAAEGNYPSSFYSYTEIDQASVFLNAGNGIVLPEVSNSHRGGRPPLPTPSSLHKLKITEVGEGGGATSFGEKVGDGGGSTAATSFLWSHF